ncbi:MAG: hypothetical protein V4864_11195 [Pseudomonadota bacterium]
MDIQLRFVNESNDRNNSEILIFSKNVATSAEEVAVAWTVIKNCGRGAWHPFTYPLTSQVGAADADGNHMPLLDAQAGQLFDVKMDLSGHVLAPAKEGASNGQEIQITNSLTEGSISACIYKDGRLFAMKTGVAPQQKAGFGFKPTIWVGVASQVDEGALLNEAIVSSIDTEITLDGIAKADIVMTGGGSGPDAQPFMFTLQNVVMA